MPNAANAPAATARGRAGFDRVDADIGAAVDRHDAIAVKPATGFDQLQREFDLDWIEGACFEQLVADAGIGSAQCDSRSGW